MSSMLDKKNLMMQDGQKNKIGFIVLAIFFIWLFYPNANSFVHISYWGNNIVYEIAKVLHIDKTPEYIHYRNNAVYLAKVYPKKSGPAFREMDKAIASVPSKIEKQELSSLYRDSAVLKLYYGDKKGALQDYLTIKDLNINDYFRIAILLTEQERYAEAVDYCNIILTESERALSGYICMSYVYEKSGRTESALKIFDYAFEIQPNSAILYKERSYLKQRLNDEKGAQEDMEAAKVKSPYSSFDNDSSMIDKAVNFKELPLSLL